MPKLRFWPLPGLLVTPAPLTAAPSFFPVTVPDSHELLLLDLAQGRLFVLMCLAILCLPRKR